MVRLLVQEGASVDVADKLERRPLHWAAYMGHGDIIRDLVQCGADVNAVDAQVTLNVYIKHTLSLYLYLSMSVSMCVCMSFALLLSLPVCSADQAGHSVL